MPITPFLVLMRMSEFGRETNLPPYFCADTDPHYSFRKLRKGLTLWQGISVLFGLRIKAFATNSKQVKIKN
jgi:hypothetical protein